MEIWILAALAAFYVKGLCGFANTLVFTSIMGFRANNINISPVELVIGVPTNIILTWKNRKHLKAKIYLPLILLLVGGSIPGAFLLKNVNSGLIKLILGVVVTFIGIEMFFRERSTKQWKESKMVLGIVGVLSGIISGLFGIGALLAAYVSRVSGNSEEFKANISIVFLAENIFRIILYSTIKVITLDSLKQSAFLMPFVLLGLFAGMKSSQILDERIVKKLVIILLIFSGGVMIWKNL